MRHAKSSWKNGALLDSDRPLNGRGNRAAQAMAPIVAAWQPQWISCSTAVRTRQTLSPILEHLSTNAEIRLTTALYESNEAAYLRLIRGLPSTVDRALVVGHNPSLADLCATLIGLADPQMLDRIIHKLPTGTLIALECPIARWSDLARASTTLMDVTRPIDLAD
jgi:phosphohistidine phosphatase